jgi:gamma-glutamyltranspeptidase/glutathione hydrolase
MKYEPFAKSLIATSLALSCLMAHAASVAPVAAENGMVVTAQHLASHVGVDVLKSGGNAVDAAVAVGYALAVVYPAAGNLGGGGFMTIQLADGRKTFLDFREKAPLAATADMYLDKDGNVVPDLSTRGHLAVGVPGTVSGMELALSKYGTKPRKEVIAPAIKLAEDGFVLEQGDVDLLDYATDMFKKDMKDSGSIFLSNGEPMQVGQKLVQKDLAKPCGPFPTRAPTASIRAGWPTPSSPPARPTRASSPRPTSTNTRPANWRRSSATTVATTWSRHRRRAPVAW